jgi:hypothetical protein
MPTVELRHGDCIEVMATLPDNSIDSIVTDPPYGLGFMGKEWDDLPPSKEWAEQCLRVLKPGGHLLAFGGTRTYHRLAVAIEDAGFEIRDSMMWLYGSGFPKSHDVSKAIDKKRDDRADILRVTSEIARLRDIAGLSNRDLDNAFGFAGMAGHWTSTKSQPTVPCIEQWAVLRDMLNPDEWLDDEVWRLNGRKGKPGEAWAEREVIGKHPNPAGSKGNTFPLGQTTNITAPATDSAKQWQGWGTALKPAHEPIVVARKPLLGTVAENVLEWGVGAMNIDGCRVGNQEMKKTTSNGIVISQNSSMSGPNYKRIANGTATGRWPANVVLSHTIFCDDTCVEGCPVGELDRQSGVSKSTGGRIGKKSQSNVSIVPAGEYEAGDPGFGDTGGASRFFYVAKANKRERPNVDGVAHPTVKPLALMQWLVRLVTPAGGTVLEPFAGSGTTVEAALLEGCNVLAIEKTEDYLPLINARIERVASAR